MSELWEVEAAKKYGKKALKWSKEKAKKAIAEERKRQREYRTEYKKERKKARLEEIKRRARREARRPRNGKRAVRNIRAGAESYGRYLQDSVFIGGHSGFFQHAIGSPFQPSKDFIHGDPLGLSLLQPRRKRKRKRRRK